MNGASSGQGPPPDGPPATAELRSFGRRRGRKLSPRQERLLADTGRRIRLEPGETIPDDLRTLFSTPVADVWLEIGFGGGEHLLWQAARNTAVGLIGAEPFVDGVVKVVTAVEEQGLGNIRVYGDDVRQLLRRLPARSLGCVFILFPDPWPKKRHRKRRLVNTALLEELARVMRDGAELRLATDIGDYARTMLEALMKHQSFEWLARSPADWRQRPPDWPETRYEQKAVREGRRSTYLRFVREPQKT